MGWFEKRAQKKLNDKLLKSCRDGNVQRIAECLDRGADIHTKSVEGFGPLVFAVSKRSLPAVQLLLDRGADINAAGYDGRTALMIACYSLNSDSGIQVAQALLSHTPAPDLSICTDDGWTALHTAVSWHCKEEDIFDLMVSGGGDINVATKDGRTPLHIAARRDNINIIKKLISLGADPTLIDANGNTPAHLAQKEDHLGIAEYLKNVANPAPSTGWTLTAEDEIAHVAQKNALGYTITSVFNFTARTYTQISRNLDTNAESQAFRFFNEVDDLTVLNNAYQELLRQGGKGTAPHLRTVFKK